MSHFFTIIHLSTSLQPFSTHFHCYHLYSPLHIITTIPHTLPPTTDQSLSLSLCLSQTCHHRTPHLFIDSGSDSPSFISGKKKLEVAWHQVWTVQQVWWDGEVQLLNCLHGHVRTKVLMLKKNILFCFWNFANHISKFWILQCSTVYWCWSQVQSSPCE